MLRNHQQQAIYECGEEIGFAVLVMVVDELLKLVAHVARTHVGRVGHYRGVLAGEVAGLGEDEVGTFGQTLIEKGVLPITMFGRSRWSGPGRRFRYDFPALSSMIRGVLSPGTGTPDDR